MRSIALSVWNRFKEAASDWAEDKAAQQGAELDHTYAERRAGARSKRTQETANSVSSMGAMPSA